MGTLLITPTPIPVGVNFNLTRELSEEVADVPFM